LTRGYVGALFENIGPDKDIPAPDVNTNPQIMAWFVDEYSRLKGRDVPESVTGKPLSLGGSKGRLSATAQGGVYVLEELVKKLKMNPKKNSVAIQGFGNAGSFVALILNKLGYKIIAI